MASCIFYILAALKFLFFICFATLSIHEKESLATKRCITLGIGSPLLFVAASLLPEQIQITILFILGALTILAAILFFIPFKKLKIEKEESDFRIDERNTMFSRLEITCSPEKSKAYYQYSPENKAVDEEWKQKAGLMSPNSAMYKTKAFAAADASFNVIGALRNSVMPQPAEEKKESDAQETTDFIKTWAKKLGAVDVGICELKPYHFYSHRGRGAAYGNEVNTTHKYAIAITVEMDKDYLATGPAAPTLMESAQQYLNSGTIALQLTHFIANMGFATRAHIDGNYEVVCPLVARDAGLGEIGRMGLLMTPMLGPRIRVAVITADIPLVADKRKYDATVHDFCGICKKCADICPSQAISKEAKKKIHSVNRWQINQEKCFGYWCTTGTDCGRCMTACPYSHPDNWFHGFIRWAIKNNLVFRHLAIKLDDIFYGRKPKPKEGPEWASYK